jgi:hypothetical protein
MAKRKDEDKTDQETPVEGSSVHGDESTPTPAPETPDAPAERESGSQDAENDPVTEDQSDADGGDDSDPTGSDSDASGASEGRRNLRQRAQSAEAQVESLTAEVEALRAQVTAARKGQVATVAQTRSGPFSPALASGDDLFGVGGHEVDAFLNPETGDVDPEAVLNAVVALLDQRPGLKRTGANVKPDRALHSSQTPGLPSEPNRGAAWVQALRNK